MSDQEKGIKAPFPWFGGKHLAAPYIWGHLGNVENYVEPFAGSLGALLARPGGAGKIETANDSDGLLSNAWRAIQQDPDGVARHAAQQVNECDLHARHLHLVRARPGLTERLMADPTYYDARLAGWWIWGACAWIGSGWCAGDGPWTEVDGLFVKQGRAPRGVGVSRQLPHLSIAGAGVHRPPGVSRQLPHLSDAGTGVLRHSEQEPDAMVREWMGALSERLRRTRIACGDWTRVVTRSVTTHCHGKRGTLLTGVLLDPPYNDADSSNDVYGTTYDASVADAAWAWAVEHGDNPRMRIVYCAYDDGRTLPDGWTRTPWKAKSGYARGRADAGRLREVLYVSPHCLRPGPVTEPLH